MEIEKTEVVNEEYTTIEYYCDICKKRMDRYHIKHILRYWGPGYDDEFCPDICDDCFLNKVIPAIKKLMG